MKKHNIQILDTYRRRFSSGIRESSHPSLEVGKDRVGEKKSSCLADEERRAGPIGERKQQLRRRNQGGPLH